MTTIRQSPIWIEAGETTLIFPDVRRALREPDGLLAAGGDLSPQRILAAYQQGIFPWYGDQQPILWWSPDPRTVLYPHHLKISRSLRKTIRRGHFKVSMDQAFEDVISACAGPRADASGTWITTEMQQAYNTLHKQGHAHSVETWLDGKLVGGLYGIAIGRVFFGESMFSRVSDASKIAYTALVQQLERWNFRLIDCQVYSPHLASLGAIEIPRSQFIQCVSDECRQARNSAPWVLDAHE